jgi:hypothetical protein
VVKENFTLPKLESSEGRWGSRPTALGVEQPNSDLSRSWEMWEAAQKFTVFETVKKMAVWIDLFTYVFTSVACCRYKQRFKYRGKIILFRKNIMLSKYNGHAFSWRVQSSRIQGHVVNWMSNDVSEKHIVWILKVASSAYRLSSHWFLAFIILRGWDGDTILRDVCWFSMDHAELYPRRQDSS